MLFSHASKRVYLYVLDRNITLMSGWIYYETVKFCSDSRAENLLQYNFSFNLLSDSIIGLNSAHCFNLSPAHHENIQLFVDLYLSLSFSFAYLDECGVLSHQLTLLMMVKVNLHSVLV